MAAELSAGHAGGYTARRPHRSGYKGGIRSSSRCTECQPIQPKKRFCLSHHDLFREQVLSHGEQALSRMRTKRFMRAFDGATERFNELNK